MMRSAVFIFIKSLIIKNLELKHRTIIIFNFIKFCIIKIIMLFYENFKNCPRIVTDHIQFSGPIVDIHIREQIELYHKSGFIRNGNKLSLESAKKNILLLVNI